MLHCVRSAATRRSSALVGAAIRNECPEVSKAWLTSRTALQGEKDRRWVDCKQKSSPQSLQDHCSIARTSKFCRFGRGAMAGFGKSLDGSAFPALSGERPQSLHSLEKKERGQEDTTSLSTAAVSTLQEPFARTAITDQPQASAGGHRGSWGGLLGSAPSTHATYSGPAGCDFAPGTSQSGSPPMSSGVAGRGRGGAGIAAASGRGRGRSHQENATDEGQEEEVSAGSSGRRDGASWGRGGGRGGASGGRGRGARSGDQIENLGRSL
jgi:hypothetical protein